MRGICEMHFKGWLHCDVMLFAGALLRGRNLRSFAKTCGGERYSR